LIVGIGIGIGDDGRRWSTMVNDGQRWSTMVNDGQRWSTMVNDGQIDLLVIAFNSKEIPG